MAVKKIGKAVWDPETEMWKVPPGSERYVNNRRLVDTRPEVKAVRHIYSRASSKNTPSIRKPVKRQEYLKEVKGLRKEYLDAVKSAFEEIKKESFEFPVLLRLDRDYDHKSDWRYCLFEGIVYQFDRAGYSSDAMVEQIRELQGPQEKGDLREPA